MLPKLLLQLHEMNTAARQVVSERRLKRGKDTNFVDAFQERESCAFGTGTFGDSRGESAIVPVIGTPSGRQSFRGSPLLLSPRVHTACAWASNNRDQSEWCAPRIFTGNKGLDSWNRETALLTRIKRAHLVCAPYCGGTGSGNNCLHVVRFPNSCC